jgi:glucose/arabinose dehydrogenase
LRQYLSRRRGRGHRSIRSGDGSTLADGGHRYAETAQSAYNHGAEGFLSVNDPYTETAADFSLVELAVVNDEQGYIQSAEAGIQEMQSLYGDWGPHLFVYYTNASPRENRVARFTVSHNRCRSKKNLVRGIPASSGYHNGGQLEFVGRHLFVSVGENHGAASAQDKGGRLGKILRYNKNGSIPRSNPFSTASERNPVWSYGHRNPFGLARRPGTKRLYETENGPDCDDEVNFIRKGRNYGWGAGYRCGTKGVGSNPKGPLKRWTPTIVPTDLWWYRGRIKSLSGSLLMGDYGSGRLHQFVLTAKGTRVKRHRVVVHDQGIVDVAKGPRGWVYFLTSSAIRRITR